MIRPRPTQIDLSRRDVRETTERLRRRREALLANVVNSPRRRHGLEEDIDLGPLAKNFNRHGHRSADGSDGHLPDKLTQEQRIRGPVRPSRRLLSGSSVASAGSSTTKEHRIHPDRAGSEHRWPSGSDLIDIGRAAFAGTRLPVEDDRDILVSRGSGRSAQDKTLDLLRDERPSEEHALPLRSHPTTEARGSRAGHDHTGRMEGSSEDTGGIELRRVPWEDELHEIGRRLSRRLTLHDPSADDQSDHHVPSQATKEPKSLRQEGLEFSFAPDLLDQTGQDQGPSQRPRLRPSRLHISQAAPSSSPEGAAVRFDEAEISPLEDHDPELPGSPRKWKRYRLQLESAVSAESETDSESLDEWRRHMKLLDRDATVNDRSSSSYTSSTGRRPSSVVRRPSRQMSPPTSLSDPPSPLSGVRPLSLYDHHRPPSPPMPARLPVEPRFSRRRSTSFHIRQPVTPPTGSSSIATETPRGSVPPDTTPSAARDRSTQRSMRVYNDSLPASQQPQTPSHRHSRPFDPAFTAPAGLRRVFRLSRPRRPLLRSGSLVRAEDGMMRADGGATEQENVSVLVEAARWEQRIRASLERRNWRSWGVRRRHSRELPVVDVDVDDDPHLDEPTDDGVAVDATRRLDRTPERDMSRVSRG